MSFNQIFLVCPQSVINLHHKTEDYRKYVLDFHVVNLHSTKRKEKTVEYILNMYGHMLYKDPTLNVYSVSP